MTEIASTTCPICNNSDQIQKLTSIVSHGTRKTVGISATSGVTDISGNQDIYSYSHGQHGESKKNRYAGKSTLTGKAHSYSTSTINSTEQTELARRLSFSPEPEHLKEPEITWVDKIDWLKFFVISISRLFLGSIFGVIATIPYEILWMINVISSSIWFADEYLIFAGIGFLIGSPIGLLIGNIVTKWYRRIDPFVSEETKKLTLFNLMKAENDKKHEQWKRAYSNWNEIYYCFRDDVVFIPKNSKVASPENIIKFCFEE